jgi:hypothetical protein
LTGWRASGRDESCESDHAVHPRSSPQHAVEVVVADAVEQAAVVFFHDLGETLDHTDRRAQIVRDGVAEGFLFVDAGVFTRLRGGQGAHGCGLGGQLAGRAHVAGKAALCIEQGRTAQHQRLLPPRGVGVPHRQGVERGVALSPRPQRVVIRLEVIPQQRRGFSNGPRRCGRRGWAQLGQSVLCVGVPLPHIKGVSQRLALGPARLQFGAQLLLLALGLHGPGHCGSGYQQGQQGQHGKQCRRHRNDCKD